MGAGRGRGLLEALQGPGPEGRGQVRGAVQSGQKVEDQLGPAAAQGPGQQQQGLGEHGHERGEDGRDAVQVLEVEAGAGRVVEAAEHVRVAVDEGLVRGQPAAAVVLQAQGEVGVHLAGEAVPGPGVQVGAGQDRGELDEGVDVPGHGAAQGQVDGGVDVLGLFFGEAHDEAQGGRDPLLRGLPDPVEEQVLVDAFADVGQGLVGAGVDAVAQGGAAGAAHEVQQPGVHGVQPGDAVPGQFGQALVDDQLAELLHKWPPGGELVVGEQEGLGAGLGQPAHLPDQPGRGVGPDPAPPQDRLRAVGAVVGTAPAHLQDGDGAVQAAGLLVLGQWRGQAVVRVRQRVQVRDKLAVGIGAHPPAAVAPGEAVHRGEVAAALQDVEEFREQGLAFPPGDHVHLGMLLQGGGVHEGGVVPARHDDGLGRASLDLRGQAQGGGVGGALGGDSHHGGAVGQHAAGAGLVDGLVCGDVALAQPEHEVVDHGVVAGVAQGRAQADQPQWGEVVERAQIEGGENETGFHGHHLTKCLGWLQ